MNRRTFIKLGLVGAGATAATVYSLNLMKIINLPQQALLPTLTSPRTGSGVPADLQVAHLLRRAGFGGTTAELSTYENMGFGGAVDALLNYQGVDNNQLDSVLPSIQLSYPSKSSQADLRALASWWLNRMVATKRPLEEKMTIFWHNHFATAFDKVRSGYLMYKQNEFLRANALGNFKDILTGMTSDGAMLVWLDGDMNRKGNPNENYAREIMEVFSTGRGPYTEDDVKNGARALTGYRVDSTGTGVFQSSLHDTGTKTFMGITGNLGPADIIDTLVSHPATAANLSTELFSFLAYPYPSKAVINRLSQVYLSSGYSIRALVEAILTSPEFLSSQAYLALVKSPAEYVATSLRSLGATADPTKSAVSMGNMGQMLFDPPSVFGWQSGLAWIDTASVLERYNFPLLIQTSSENPASALNPSVFGSPSTGSEATEALVRPLFPDGMPEDFMKVIDSSTAALSDPVLKTKNAVRLAMASPFYNLN